MDVPTLDRLLLHGLLQDLMSQVPQVVLQEQEILEPVAGQEAPLGPEDVATSAEHPLHSGRAREGSVVADEEVHPRLPVHRPVSSTAWTL